MLKLYLDSLGVRRKSRLPFRIRLLLVPYHLLQLAWVTMLLANCGSRFSGDQHMVPGANCQSSGDRVVPVLWVSSKIPYILFTQSQQQQHPNTPQYIFEEGESPYWISNSTRTEISERFEQSKSVIVALLDSISETRCRERNQKQEMILWRVLGIWFKGQITRKARGFVNLQSQGWQGVLARSRALATRLLSQDRSQERVVMLSFLALVARRRQFL